MVERQMTQRFASHLCRLHQGTAYFELWCLVEMLEYFAVKRSSVDRTDALGMRNSCTLSKNIFKVLQTVVAA